MSKECRRIFLGNLNYKAQVVDIEQALRALDVGFTSVRIVTNADTNKSRGFAFVDIAPDEPRSIEELSRVIDGTCICGRECRADRAHDRRVPEKRDGGKRHNQGKDYAW